MARRSRGKKKGIIATLLLELSALAGIFGVTQATLRNNLWQVLKPQAVNSQLDQAPGDIGNPQVLEVPRFTGIAQSPTAQPPAFTQGFDQYASQSQPIVPRYVPEPYQSTYPPAYTAQAILPQNPRNSAGWNPSGYNPMGSYQ